MLARGSNAGKIIPGSDARKSVRGSEVATQEAMLALTRQDARNKEIEVWERDPLQNPCTLMKNRFSSTVLRFRQEASVLRSDAARPGSSFLDKIET
ncbi:hypothetical protein V513_08765 [Mesotoga sp. H07.pep.5.3]|nr:hypothetical protein V513_08765 [Mesotoga sp. H07.pep.5.3]